MQTENGFFSFGKNWQDFVEHRLTSEKIAVAKRHLLGFLEVPDLQGKSFLDIGCGSGLSSLAAYELGAEKIVSFDKDPYSVRTTNMLREMTNNPPNWIVLHGSVVDAEFLKELEPADIVYAWGVLHHTGKMWEAFAQTSTLLAERGLLYISLYTTRPTSQYWIHVKKQYNQASPLKKRLMEAHYILRYTLLPRLLRAQNPFRYIFDQQRKRGMSYLTDVRDWLGGYPYEDAKIEEVLRFARKTLNLELINITTARLTTEYLFAKKAFAPSP